jgi:hypothetical protein
MEIKPDLRLRLEHYRNGKLLQVVDRPTRSLTKWFARGMLNAIFTGEELFLTFEDGSSHTGTVRPYKIAIGDDNTPFSLEDYCLKHKLFEVTKDSPDYAETEEPTDTGTQCEFEHQAIFRFTASYNIWEIGFFSYRSDPYYTGYWLMSRDVLDSAITVTNGDTLVVKYKGTVS